MSSKLQLHGHLAEDFTDASCRSKDRTRGEISIPSFNAAHPQEPRSILPEVDSKRQIYFPYLKQDSTQCKELALTYQHDEHIFSCYILVFWITNKATSDTTNFF